MLLIDELAQRGCHLAFLERPMSQDPHDYLLFQIRGAVAEYERTLIADRMRRSRQAKSRGGQLPAWSVPPYGYVMDPERSRDSRRLWVDPVKAAVISQMFSWYTDAHTPATLYGVAKRLTNDQMPTPRGGHAGMSLPCAVSSARQSTLVWPIASGLVRCPLASVSPPCTRWARGTVIGRPRPTNGSTSPCGHYQPGDLRCSPNLIGAQQSNGPSAQHSP
jgi:site-specific DNA recombinase